MLQIISVVMGSLKKPKSITIGITLTKRELGHQVLKSTKHSNSEVVDLINTRDVNMYVKFEKRRRKCKTWSDRIPLLIELLFK